MWSDEDDQVIGGDLTAGLAYLTPAGGAVLTPISPFGLRDRHAGTVSFTSPVGGQGRKLDHISRNPSVALAFHAREHGFSNSEHFVLVQGKATFDDRPDPAVLAAKVWPAISPFIGPRVTGFFWDWWLRGHYEDRVLVTVLVERVISWPDLQCSGTPTVVGPPYRDKPDSQTVPKKGASPRVDCVRVARRLRALPHVLVAYRGVDGFPLIVPVRADAVSTSGIRLNGPLCVGHRRAGLLGHRFGARALGLEMRQYTGWLSGQIYAPHTESGFRAPANKTLTNLGLGLMARREAKQKVAPRKP